MLSPDARAKSGSDPSPRLTLCLAMDLKQSTAAGLKMSTRRLDRFNLALVNQIGPHLKTVGLDGVRIKFTGDGWLLMSNDPDDAAPLCCLAVIMAVSFQADMSREAGLPLAQVPALRLAVCWARDLEVLLPDGQIDFVGDSVRHAVRACQFCRDNEIIIDETVQRWVQHDFLTTRLDLGERLAECPGAKMEQELALHTLHELKLESAAEVDAPVCFVNTLSAIGRDLEAEALADRIADHLQLEAEVPGSDAVELRERFNQLLASHLDYETASRILRDMQEAGLAPDRSTYLTLILKAEDYATKCIWLQRMKQKGLAADLATYNELLRTAEDRAARRRWLTKMKRDGVTADSTTLNLLIGMEESYKDVLAWLDRLGKEDIHPNAATYDLLIEKAADVQDGKQWIDCMFAAGIQPGMLSLLTLFAKDMGTLSADELLQWYLSLPYHPPEPMQRAIAAYRRRGDIDGAIRLALDYPYTEAAKKIFRAHPERTIARFRAVVEEDPRHPNGAYALGTVLLEIGRSADAEPWLQRALELAAPGPRRDELTKHLFRIRGEAVADTPPLAVVSSPNGRPARTAKEADAATL